jgi:hypothetical protein
VTRHLSPINWIQWLTLALAVTVAITVPILYFRIGGVQAHQNDALRSILCRAAHVVRTQPGIPAAERRRAERFYRTALKDAHLAPCD